MMKKIYRLLYKFHLKKKYREIDRLRYLKRLRTGKHPDDEEYFSTRDLDQFEDGEVLITTRYRGATVMLSCQPPFSAIERQLISLGMFDPHVLDLMGGLSSENSMVLDVGANIGVYSVSFAKAFPNIQVHSFEPNQFSITRFLKNASMNKLSNLHLHKTGVGSSPGTLDLFSHKDCELGGATFLASQRQSEMSECIPVEVVALDHVFKGSERNISLIKIDVQGFELEVLKGAKELIRTHRPYILFEHEDVNFQDEVSAKSAKEGLKRFFDENGYLAYYVTRYDHNMMFPVSWDRSLCGDILALPVRADGH